MTKLETDIQAWASDLQRRMRNARTEALAGVRLHFAPELEDLQNECEFITGHKWNFAHWNITHTVETEKCGICQKTRSRDI